MHLTSLLSFAHSFSSARSFSLSILLALLALVVSHLLVVSFLLAQPLRGRLSTVSIRLLRSFSIIFSFAFALYAFVFSGSSLILVRFCIAVAVSLVRFCIAVAVSLVRFCIAVAVFTLRYATLSLELVIHDGICSTSSGEEWPGIDRRSSILV
jgi:hypothetical protein